MIELMRELICKKNDRGLDLVICVGEWCNTADDVKKFTDSGGAEMIQVKFPVLGGLHQTIEALRYCDKGESRLTSVVAAARRRGRPQISPHVALATQPFQILAKPVMELMKVIRL